MKLKKLAPFSFIIDFPIDLSSLSFNQCVFDRFYSSIVNVEFIPYIWQTMILILNNFVIIDNDTNYKTLTST